MKAKEVFERIDYAYACLNPMVSVNFEPKQAVEVTSEHVAQAKGVLLELLTEMADEGWNLEVKGEA